MERDLDEIRTLVKEIGRDQASADSGKKAILRVLSRLEKKQHDQLKIHSDNQKRVDEILDVVMCIARFDYSVKARVSRKGDHIDALASGINMLGEELQNSAVSLEEKESLLKEVHHRVKNNLQVISSLLSLQSATIKDPEAHRKFMESCNRIRTMAMVHEKLYMGKDFSRVHIQEYLVALLKYLNACYFQMEKRVELIADIRGGKTLFNIDEAIPLGLILNELLTNAFKYAFPNGVKGKIRIGFTEIKSRNKAPLYCLLVKDNGCGLPPKMNVNQTATLGLQLVTILTEQLGGKLKVIREKGVGFEITFGRIPERLKPEQQN